MQKIFMERDVLNLKEQLCQMEEEMKKAAGNLTDKLTKIKGTLWNFVKERTQSKDC